MGVFMSQVKRIVFVMDAYASLNLETETSLLLMEELIGRGHQVFWLEVHGVSLQGGCLKAKVSQVKSVQNFKLLPCSEVCLDNFDALLLRIDPPVDTEYLHLTYLLSFLSPSVKQFNAVASLRNFNEKLLPLKWPEVCPATLVSRNIDDFKQFLALHREIVMKPLGDCSGRGIQRFSLNDIDSAAFYGLFAQESSASAYFMAQEFLDAVEYGDKRIFLVNGEVAGFVNRIPKTGEFLANIHQGATCEATDLTEFELNTINKIAPFLKAQGLLFVGLDFIGGYLTEVNITSPSAIRQINQVMGVNAHKLMVDSMLGSFAKGRLSHCCNERNAA